MKILLLYLAQIMELHKHQELKKETILIEDLNPNNGKEVLEYSDLMVYKP